MKNKKLLRLTPLFLVVALMLSGCVRRTSSGKPYGFVYEHFAIPTQHLLEWLATILGGSYGWSIIVITFVVRLVLMPVMVSQAKKATIQQEKLASVKPQLKAIQDRQKTATTQAEKAALSQEMMLLYKENGISMTGGIGCLPLLIQMPIFAALYAAIEYSPELSKSYFFGINLGHRSFLFVILSLIMYGLQGWLSVLGVPEDQKQQMKSMMFVSPLMIGGMVYFAPAGLGLYFFIGGIFACLQTLIVNALRPKIRAEIHEQLKNRPIKAVEPIPVVNKSKVTEAPAKLEQTHQINRQRNAEKQNRKPQDK